MIKLPSDLDRSTHRGRQVRQAPHGHAANERLVFIGLSLEFHRLAPYARKVKTGNLWQEDCQAEALQVNLMLNELGLHHTSREPLFIDKSEILKRVA